MRRLSFILALMVIVFNFTALFAAEEAGNLNVKSTLRHMLLDISQLGRDEFSGFKADKNMVWWCELDNDFFISYQAGSRPRIPAQAAVKNEILTESKMSEPMLAIKRGLDSPLDEFAGDINIIYETGPYVIFQTPPDVLNKISKKESNHFKLESLKQNIRVAVNARYLDIAEVKNAGTVSVDLKRMTGYIKTFENFKTRYSYSQGYLDAANFAADEFKKMGLDAQLVEYLDGGKKQYNVVAQKKAPAAGGAVNNGGDKFYIVGGHLDSMSPNPSIEAPGADDNASGSAGAMEVANIISKYPFAHKVRFVLFAGEELGLRGSKAYVSQLKTSGEIAKVAGMVNLDMIGFDRVPPISSLWQTRQTFDPFVSNFLSVAKQAAKLKITMSYNVWGSDHVSFINAGVPAFLFIEDEYGANPNYHKITDRLETLNPEMLEEFVRIIAQGLVNILSAEGQPQLK
jgi:hypothetical protein